MSSYPLAGAAILCCLMGAPSMKPNTLRPREGLAVTDLGWVRIRDHFVQTVGPQAGTGVPLGDLLVLADATFAPRSRFPLHTHEQMEIVTVIVEGTLTHYEPTRAVRVAEGATQLMSSGDGLTHAEGNQTDTPVRMLQIWLRPNAEGPAEHQVLGPHVLGPVLKRVTPASLRQDASISMAQLSSGERLTLSAAHGRAVYVLCLGGPARVGLGRCRDGDGLLVSGDSVELEAIAPLRLVAIDVRAP